VTDESVKLGLMAPLTGLVGIYGSEISHAALIACNEVNEKGGVLGRPLELIIEDDGSLPESAVVAANKLIDQHHCSAIIGNLLSNSRIAVAYRVAEPRKIPYLNFSFYEGSILSRYFFHFAALPNQQIEKMIPFMLKRYGPRMFFAGNNYEWPRGSIHAAKRVLEDAGGEVVGTEYTSIGVSEEEIECLLDHVEAAKPDVFVPYFAGDDQVNLLKRFTRRGLKKNMAVVMGHFDEMMASQMPPGVREGFYSSNTYFMTLDNEENHRYLDKLAELSDVNGIWPQGNGILTNFGVGTYTCVKAFAKAANNAGSLDSEAIVDTLKNISLSTPQGMVEMNPEHHHAKVNTCLSCCRANGQFEIIRQFGAIDPILPERYNHQRINHESSLEDNFRLQARMLEQMSEGVILVSPENGKILYTNAGAEKIFGYSKEEMINLPFMRLIRPLENDPDETIAVITRTLNQTGEWQGEIRNRKKDGTLIWCSVTVTTFTHPFYGEIWLGVHRDITEQKNMEQELGYERNFATRLLNTAPVIVLLLDTNGYIKYVNPYFEQVSGYRFEEIQGKEWFSSFLPSRDQARIRELFNHAMQDSQTKAGINPIITKDGNERNIEWYDQVMNNENSEVSGLLAIGQDVTDREQTQGSLKKEQIFISAVLESIEDGIVACDEQGVLTYFNDVTARFHGIPQKDLPAKEWAQHYSLFLADGTTPMKMDDVPLFRALKGEAILNEEMVIAPVNGVKRSILASGCELRDSQGNKLGAVVSMHDVTRLKNANAELSKKESELAEAQFIGHMGSWHWDIQSGVLKWSDEIFRIFGLHPQSIEVSYDYFLQRVHPQDRKLVQVAVNRALQTLNPYNVDHRITLPDGSIRFVHEQGEVRFNEQGEAIRMIGTVQDITDRKLAENRILATLDEKDTILRELHHRVKNNMQVISSLLSLQARHTDSRNPQKALQESRQRIRAMALIHERLYGSDDLAVVDFLDYLRYLSERLTRIYHETGIALKIQVDGEPLQLPIDHALPCALICNELITNAIRHAYPADQKDRLIEIRITDSTNGGAQLVVRDYGSGIRQGVLDGKRGSLGLVIIQALTRQLNGEIEFESTIGTLAKLTFQLHTNKKPAYDSYPRTMGATNE